MILTHADNGKSIEVLVGVPLSVRLDEAPTTGYRWHLDIDGDAVSMRSSRFEEKAEKVVGGGGQASFDLSVNRPGRATLRFKLWREWEGNSSIIQRVIIDIEAVAQR